MKSPMFKSMPPLPASIALEQSSLSSVLKLEETPVLQSHTPAPAATTTTPAVRHMLPAQPLRPSSAMATAKPVPSRISAASTLAPRAFATAAANRPLTDLVAQQPQPAQQIPQPQADLIKPNGQSDSVANNYHSESQVLLSSALSSSGPIPALQSSLSAPPAAMTVRGMDSIDSSLPLSAAAVDDSVQNSEYCCSQRPVVLLVV